MSLTALKRQPADQLATQALKNSILAGEFKPGERLTEAALADQFAVSRGTVRAALHQLSNDGLVVLRPYAGWSVATIDQQDLWEIYTLRSGLERVAARLAAERIDEAGRIRLTRARDAFFAACERSDREASLDYDFALHHCIIELSGNGRLATQYQMVEQQIRLFINSTYGSTPNMSVAIAHHAPIIDAILAGDGATAASLSEDHVLSEGARVFGQAQGAADGE
ncbi:GntR family transcriptional regulator [Azospirillum endophyticum]